MMWFLMARLAPRRLALAWALTIACCVALPGFCKGDVTVAARGEVTVAGHGNMPVVADDDVPVEQVFAAVPFEEWVKQGPAAAVPWKVHISPYGLSLQQRMRAHVDIELPRRELMKRAPDDRIVALIQLTDGDGRQFRDYELFRIKDVGPEIKKGELDVFWDMYVLPGEYQVTVALADAARNEHNLMQGHLRVPAPKNDPLPEVWQGLPAVEFLAPHEEGPDAMFRPDVTTKLHLPLATKRPVRLEVLADVTASDLFHGSTVFYERYLSVAVPLLKALSQVELKQGTLDVAMLDLRRRSVTFEQDSVKELDWPRARNVLAPKNGPATIDIKALEQKRESPAFLQDELLRRLNAPLDGASGADPLHVFVIIGSPMDFYSFRDLPHLPPGSEEKCVVYYLQFELLNPSYADGAVGNVRKMLKPLTVHVFKVRSAESIRHALARMLEGIGQM
jgi:hypothetical protein